MSDIEQRLREAMDGVTPGPWEPVSLSGYGSPFSIRMAYSSDNPNAPSTHYGVQSVRRREDAAYIALCSPDNIGALLDTIASLRSKLEEAEGARDRLMRAAYLAGFQTSSEGYNAEYPFEGENIEDDKRWCEGRDLALASLREADHA